MTKINRIYGLVVWQETKDSILINLVNPNAGHKKSGKIITIGRREMESRRPVKRNTSDLL